MVLKLLLATLIGNFSSEKQLQFGSIGFSKEDFLFLLFFYILRIVAVYLSPLITLVAPDYLPFEDFFKCYIAEDKCPNKNITFFLYTR